MALRSLSDLGSLVGSPALRDRRPERTIRRSLPPQARSRGVTAVLGPTNTGKTHLAIERMLGHESGMIGLPLRLLAREVYSRVVERAGVQNVALVTGEEKIKPDRARYWISTVEAMPRDLDLSFVAVDEIQLAADLDRGHVFTDRLLNQRGRDETLLIGSSTMRPLIEALIPGVHVVTRPRLSKLSFAGEKKVSRLPHRSAIVAFSAEEVYAIAELIRRQRGGAAVVLGALSPRTRNAQVELYQSGDVDYLVATDAIGMGLNLDVDHVAFASDKKFDGFRFRKLYPSELGQIAGRAGRYMRDGTFGSTARCPPFDAETVQALEDHAFDPVQVLQWRNPDLNFASIGALRESLADQPREHGLVRAPMGEDLASLEILAREDDIQDLARSRSAVERLWQVCQVPDYRKTSPQTHSDLVGQLYRFLMTNRAIPDDWFGRHVAAMDRTDGDIDTLSNRIAQIRTWTFVANRPDWLRDPEHWQGVTRQVEDKLSDALHERLAQRFVDRRTSVLMRRLRENAMLEAQITAAGDVTVEGQHVGHLHGFLFVPDPGTESAEEAKTLRSAAQKALASEIEARADRLAMAADTTLVLSNDGTVRWQGDPVAKLEPGDKLYEPRLRLLADEQLNGPARDKADTRIKAWLKAHVVRLLGPALGLEDHAELAGLARGIAFQVAESLGVLERSKVLNEVRGLDQDGRAALRKLGVRFGAYHLYLPALLKPAPRTLAAQLWALTHGGLDQKGIDEIAHLAGSGRTSIPVDTGIAPALYRAAGFRVCGARAVRVDILERLADLIRPAIAYRPGVTPGEPPPGTADGEGFVPTVSMTSLVGCSGEDFASILRSLGYVAEPRPGPAITVPLVPPPRVVAPAASAPAGTADAPQEVPLPEAAADASEQDAAAEEPARGLDAGTAQAAPDGADSAADAETAPAVQETAEPAPADEAADPTPDAGAAESPLDAAPETEAPGEPAPDPESGPDATEPASAEAALVSPEMEPAAALVADAAAPEGDMAAASVSAGDPPEGQPAADAVSGGATDAPERQPAAEAFSGGATDASEGQPAADAPGEGAMDAPEGQPAADASGEGGTADASAAEAPALIEVWRLQRRHERQQPRHARSRQGREGERRREGGRPQGDTRPGERPQGERPQGDRPQGDRPPGDRRPDQRRDRPDRGAERRAEGEGGRPQNRPPRQERTEERRTEERRGPRPEPRADNRRNGGGPDRRPDQRRDDRREKAPDPNSPFAKLAALKAQLEDKGGKR